MNDQAIFAEYSHEELANAINIFLSCTCWTAEVVEEWRERYIESGYMVGFRDDYACIEGEEHSNFSFICFLEDRMHGNYYGEEN